ncbi:MAG: phospholipid carrier-dependent glycosyltransferase [Candidatus Wildermuthbacteria bacterium]|nr:phospholipid carrier-dependent glycosyltransferase [Candidatus Wildermuthbacteria bacterium]
MAFIKFKKEILFLALLLSFSLATHFLFLGHPSEVVFDEYHYGKFVNGYLEGKYFYNIHPPLATQLITLGGWLDGYQTPKFSFETIGGVFSDSSYLGLRFFPALAGSLIPLALYFFLKSIGAPFRAAFLAGALISLDNALLAQSRLALPDSILLLLGILGLGFFFLGRRNNYKTIFLLFAGIFFALSFSVKWTGFAFLGLAGVITLFDLIKILFLSSFRAVAFPLIKSFLFLFLIPIAIYFEIYNIHFALLPNPGPGNPYMSKEFNEGNLTNMEKFIEINQINYTINKGFAATHPYGSKWYTWPFMSRPIYYWNNDGATEKIYFLGNPVVWWGSTLTLLLLPILLFFKQLWKERIVLILAAGYIVSFVPFLIVSRVMFLYHYLIPLIFAVSLFAYLATTIKPRYAKILSLLLALAALISFFYFAPLTYGFPLDKAQFENRMWLSTWP